MTPVGVNSMGANPKRIVGGGGGGGGTDIFWDRRQPRTLYFPSAISVESRASPKV